ncbi:gamma carbonic anhydrase family protein [Paraferrimonas sp. SM1919]|uniref:gamma carbonic anhydrase family protein n=1 Tax=Paraferrimonas sp. SM1919 TaxID=2662263 RepID=UPI0013D16C55|nr:gamma carbonic anhydrase family protein [Paraferrimonas sp. SM1919]
MGLVNHSIRAYQGNKPNIAPEVYVDPQACVIGNVTLNKDSSVWPMAVIRGDVNEVIIGERTSVQDGCVLHVTHRSDFNSDGFALTIGNDVTIGHKACLHGCTLESEILVGMGAIILDGAYIESQVVIGAGSVVPPGKRLQSGFLYLGNPIRQVRCLNEQELSFFKYAAAKYVKTKNDYLQHN